MVGHASLCPPHDFGEIYFNTHPARAASPVGKRLLQQIGRRSALLIRGISPAARTRRASCVGMKAAVEFADCIISRRGRNRSRQSGLCRECRVVTAIDQAGKVRRRQPTSKAKCRMPCLPPVSTPIATGDRANGLAQEIRQVLLPFGRRRPCDQVPFIVSTRAAAPRVSVT